MPEQIGAARQIGTQFNTVTLLALVLESRADPVRYAPLVRLANKYSPRPAAEADIDTLLDTRRFTENRLIAATAKAIRELYQLLDQHGDVIERLDEAPADGLAGESTLDWIDRV